MWLIKDPMHKLLSEHHKKYKFVLTFVNISGTKGRSPLPLDGVAFV